MASDTSDTITEYLASIATADTYLEDDVISPLDDALAQSVQGDYFNINKSDIVLYAGAATTGSFALSAFDIDAGLYTDIFLTANIPVTAEGWATEAELLCNGVVVATDTKFEKPPVGEVSPFTLFY